MYCIGGCKVCVWCVYVSVDAGNNWYQMQNNMPTIPIHDLTIHPRENDLVAVVIFQFDNRDGREWPHLTREDLPVLLAAGIFDLIRRPQQANRCRQ